MSFLSLVTVFTGEYAEARQRDTTGIGHDFTGRLVLIDVNKAAAALGEGAQIKFLNGSDTDVYQVHNGRFESLQNPGCYLTNSNDGVRTSCTA